MVQAFDPIKNTKNLADVREQENKEAGVELLNKHNLAGRVYYQGLSRGMYWHPNADNEWVSDSSTDFDDYLLDVGGCPDRNDNKLSDLKRIKKHIREYGRVDYVGGLSGWPAGYREINGYRCLVTKEAKQIEPSPKPGCPTILEFIEGLFGPDDEGGIDQLPYFLGWLRHALIGLNEMRRPGGTLDLVRGLALVLAGDPGGGKTLLATKIIGGLLGGRIADPFDHMTGLDQFNGECLISETWLIDDRQSDREAKARTVFSAAIKQAVATPLYRIRGMQKEGITLVFFRRLVIATNTQLQRIRALPELEEDLQDKVMILKPRVFRFPMANATPEERAEVERAIADELPSFAYWLLNVWEDKTGVTARNHEGKDPRFGVWHYHHPDIEKLLFKVSKDVHVWEQVKRVLFPASEFCSSWREHLTATELLDRMRESDKLSPHERNHLPLDCERMGSALRAVIKIYPDEIKWHKVKAKQGYTIVRADRTLAEAVDSLRGSE